MKIRRVYTLVIVLTALMYVGADTVMADDYGIGGEDFILEDHTPDLLTDERPWDEENPSDIIYDPLEPINRVSFAFNDKLYFWVLKPVKRGYVEVLPSDIRGVIGNFFNNLEAPIDLVNNLLQGRFSDAGTVLARFSINTTIGVFGFGDVAAEEFDLESKKADFGQTLGVYGLGEGLYICWPILGPSNLRDSVGQVGDWPLHPYSYAGFFDTETETIARSTEFINRLSNTSDAYEEIVRISLDPYVATREAYTEYRRNLIKTQLIESE